jgi:DNA-binding transcriptional MocR family regulator
MGAFQSHQLAQAQEKVKELEAKLKSNTVADGLQMGRSSFNVVRQATRMSTLRRQSSWTSPKPEELDPNAGIMEYGSLHQEELDGLLASLATKEVRESVAATAGLEDLMQMQSRTGVIYASTRAKQWGFKGPGDPDWGNLGQGAPETSPVPNQPPRISKVDLEDDQGNEYSDVNGRKDLRQAIADYYNFFFRQGMASQYTYENVCVTGGGRSGLNRLMGSLQNINVGYTTPDYTAYSQLLGEFVGISPIPVAHDDPEGLLTTAPELRKQIRLHGLGAFLLSNPGNPTGKPIEGGLLDKYVRIAREENCLFLMDEFYSHYMYEAQAS